MRLLRARHPGFSGPSFCQSSRIPKQSDGILCFAEIHKGLRYVQVWANASLADTVSFKHVSTGSWTRHWSKYSPPPQRVSPGLISTNAQGFFDWRWLVLGADALCRQRHRNSCTAGALDGPYGGYPPLNNFFEFSCDTRGPLIACRNALGDAIRWRPLG